MDSFTCIDWYMSLLTATRKCTAVLTNYVAFYFLILIVNSIFDCQWHGIPPLEDGLTLFLGDEKINYFSIPCFAKHFLNFGFFSGWFFLFSWVYHPCYSECGPWATSIGIPCWCVRNGASGLTPDSPNQNLILRRSQGDVCAHWSFRSAALNLESAK